MKLRIWTLTLAVAAPLTAWCDDAPPPPPPPQHVWTGKGQAGFVASQGNSEGKSANVALDMTYQADPWKHLFHLAGLYGDSAGIVSAERWDTLWQSNYDLTKNLFTFVQLHYTRDMFSGFQYQAAVSAGLGYKIFDTDALHLSLQAGAGYGELRPETLIKDDTGAVVTRNLLPKEDSAIGTFGLNYAQNLTKTTTLTDKLQVEYGSINTLATNALALAVKISNKLAMSVGYMIQYNTSPPAGLKKQDTNETINLVYSF
jgi:putative salt-induced outer membrane protein